MTAPADDEYDDTCFWWVFAWGVLVGIGLSWICVLLAIVITLFHPEMLK